MKMSLIVVIQKILYPEIPLFPSADIPVLLMDQSGRIEEANPSYPGLMQTDIIVFAQTEYRGQYHLETSGQVPIPIQDQGILSTQKRPVGVHRRKFLCSAHNSGRFL